MLDISVEQGGLLISMSIFQSVVCPLKRREILPQELKESNPDYTRHIAFGMAVDTILSASEPTISLMTRRR